MDGADTAGGRPRRGVIGPKGTTLADAAALEERARFSLGSFCDLEHGYRAGLPPQAPTAADALPGRDQASLLKLGEEFTHVRNWETLEVREVTGTGCGRRRCEGEVQKRMECVLDRSAVVSHCPSLKLSAA